MYVSLFVAFLTGHHWTWVVTPVPRSPLHRSPVGGWVVPRLSSAGYRWAWSLLSRLHLSSVGLTTSWVQLGGAERGDWEHAGQPIRLPWDKHNAPLLLFTWKMFILMEWSNQYLCTGEHFQWGLDISQFDFMFVKPHDVLPLLCFDVQNEMRFWVE